MKNFNSKQFFTTVAAALVAFTIFDLGKAYVNKSKTTPPATE
jgi:hypothetical protein